MATYRKKPVEIQAWQIRKVHADKTENMPWFVVHAVIDGKINVSIDGSITIKTLEGFMTGNVGDYLIQGVQGELYPCKPDIFAETYEPVVKGRNE